MPLLPSLGSNREGRRNPIRLNTLTPEQRLRRLRQLQQTRLGQPEKKDRDIWGVPDIVEDAVGQIAGALIHTPAGLWHMGKEIGADVGDLFREGDFTPERTGRLGLEMGRSIVEDFRHPRENIGYLLMDLFAGGSLALRAGRYGGRVGKNIRNQRGSFPDDPPLLHTTESLPPVPGGGGGAGVSAPKPSAAEVLRAQASAISETAPTRILTPKDESVVPPITQGLRDVLPSMAKTPLQQRLEGFPQSAFKYEAPPRTVLEPELPPVHPRQRSLFYDHEGLGDAPKPHAFQTTLGGQQQIPGLLNGSPLPPPVPRLARPVAADVAPPAAAVAKPKSTKAKGGKRTEPELPEGAAAPQTIEELAAAVAATRGLLPRHVDLPDHFDAPVKERYERPSKQVKVYTDNKNKRISIDGDTLNMRPVEEAGKIRFQLFDGDQPLKPVVHGFENAKDVLAEAHLARKAEAHDSPLLEKVPPPKADPLAALTKAVDEKAAGEAKKTLGKEHGEGRFRVKETDLGYAVIDTLKGSQHKVYEKKDVDTLARRRSLMVKEIHRLEGKSKKRVKDSRGRTKWVDKKLSPADAKELSVLRASLKELDKNADADVVLQEAVAHADRLNRAFSREKTPEKPAAAAKPTKPPNPSELGISQKQLESYGLSKNQAKELTKRLAPEIRTLWKEAIAAGKDKPTRRSVHEALERQVGPDLAKKITSRMMRVRGGQGLTFGSVMRALREELQEPARTHRLTMKEEVVTKERREIKPKPGFTKGKNKEKGARSFYTVEKTHTETKTADVPLSRNPLVAEAQKVLLRSYEKYPNFKIKGVRRDLKGRMEFERREISRIADLLTQVAPQVTEDRFTEAARKSLKKPIKEGASAGDWIDSMNQGAKFALLFLKPAYVPANILGQIGLTLADHAFHPVQLARSWKLSYDVTLGKSKPELAKLNRRLDDAMQQGFVSAIAHEKGAVRPISVLYEKGADLSSKALDMPFRRATFFNEARRFGYDTPAKLIKLLESTPGTKMGDELIQIARRANRHIIDYGRMGPKEKMLVRRIVFFYPWMKGATIYGGHFLSEHFLQGAAMIHQGKAAQERTEQELGPLPSYLEGVFKVGETDVPGLGKVPKVINPAAASVLGTPGEVLNFGRALIGGNVREADQPSGVLTPGLTAIAAAVFRQDPFTGRDYPASKTSLGIIADELKKTAAPVQFWRAWKKAEKVKIGELDPREILYPGSGKGAFGRFMVGPTPIALNTREAQSRAFAERRSLADKRQREVMRHNDYRKLYTEKAREVGALGPNEDLPPRVREAFLLRTKRYANRAAFSHKLGRRLQPLDRLQADLDQLVRDRKMDETRAKTLLLTFANYDDETITRILRTIGEQFYMSPVLSAYRAALNDKGADISVP